MPTPRVESFDAGGNLLWDLIHPTAAAHRLIAIVAHTMPVATHNLLVAADD